MLGLEVSITLTRPGFRIKERKVMKRKIPMHHRIAREEAVDYFKTNFKLEITEEQVEDEE